MRVAIIGSGIAGLGTAYLLNKSGGFKVTVYEKESTCGGHALTDSTVSPPVDLGFQVFNLTTYPHLNGLFRELQLETEESDMSFSISVDKGRLEWASLSLDSVFAQRSNVCSISFLSMIRDAFRFSREAPKVLGNAEYNGMSINDYFAKHRYSKSFIQDYFLPMTAAIWSCSDNACLSFPIQTIVAFWVNHHLLSPLGSRPIWRVVKSRSQAYVRKLVAQLPDVRTNSPVELVKRLDNGKILVRSNDREELYDSVVFATHADDSLKILGADATEDEKDILGSVEFAVNEIVLHSDVSFMPNNRKAWASWNVLDNRSSKHGDQNCCTTYWLNRLQNLPPGTEPRFCTLNPPTPPNKVIRKLFLSHPVLSQQTVNAQRKMHRIQGWHNTYHVGAWMHYGFHEDGLKAAVSVAKSLGAIIPWGDGRCLDPHIGWTDKLASSVVESMGRTAFKKGCLDIILPNGQQFKVGNGDPKATIQVYDMKFFKRILLFSDIGLGESYMNHEFDTDNLVNLLSILTMNAHNVFHALSSSIFNQVGGLAMYLLHKMRPNTLDGSRANISDHYDLGNSMYKMVLDKSMTYSCAIFPSPESSLHDAQLHKLDQIIAKAELTANHHVLEIGCGWGSFAIRAVQTTGCRVTGLTISQEQLDEATQRVNAAGLQDKIQIVFCDYREFQAEHLFDSVVSIEMIEAVGHENIPQYFRVIDKMLKPGGKAVIQAIGMPDERYKSYLRASDFIRRYIFPGGHLPCKAVLEQACAGTRLQLVRHDDYTSHYAKTLSYWNKNLLASAEELVRLGYSKEFLRKFEFYFAICEAGFAARYIYTWHLVYKKSERPLAANYRKRAHFSPLQLFILAIFASPPLYLLVMKIAKLVASKLKILAQNYLV